MTDPRFMPLARFPKYGQLFQVGGKSDGRKETFFFLKKINLYPKERKLVIEYRNHVFLYTHPQARA